MTDDGIRECLLARVSQLLPALDGGAPTPLVRNVYSFVFAIEPAVAGHPGVFVKIPKADMRKHPPRILPLTEADRALGRAEYDSLRYIESRWTPGAERVEFVRPLAYYPDVNAIVTVRALAADALDTFRRLAVGERLRRATGASDRLRRIAAALRRFHACAAEPSVLAVAAWQAKVLGYVSLLREYEVAARGLERLEAELRRRRPAEDIPVSATSTLKGIDIRNVLVSDDDRLFMLDPGALKRAPVEADLARFLITWRILFWGRPSFAAGATPPASAEEAFLTAYGPFEPRALRLMLIKELLKHWTTAHESLSLKRWGRAKVRLLAAAYVDPFYQRQLRRELGRLAG